MVLPHDAADDRREPASTRGAAEAGLASELSASPSTWPDGAAGRGQICLAAQRGDAHKLPRALMEVAVRTLGGP